jgi:histone-lysine N-methyltransferase SETMAR
MLTKYEEGKSKRVFDIITGDETWIYQFDPETKRQSASWTFHDEEPPTKVRRSRSVGKKMVATFFMVSGHNTTIPLEDRKTVNAEWYTTKCLPYVFEKIIEKRPKTGIRGLLFHHDNASAHTANRTLDFLETNKVRLLTHPPYSPDLAPCDFFLFPYIKNLLRGTLFNTPNDAVDAYMDALKDVPKESWKKCFENWFKRMKLCIDADGAYFEKIK